MKIFLSVVQIILSVLLIGAVLLQHSGSGLGSAFGGGGTIHTTKRGIDKVLYNATIVISILFFVAALLNLLIK